MLGRNELVADDTGRVSAKDTGEREEIPAQLVVRAVGYRGVQTPGLPFDEKSGTIPHSAGRVEGSRNEYVVGCSAAVTHARRWCGARLASTMAVRLS